ncbi:nuclear transport factor 2 family protein [Ralstonia pseudosolanacearum]|uniref:nuclear transport factor 2 family protein n=1 Tax=Ralstonia pseudosolanacearum TaxID=1310165 RepID=UPI0022341454|nr:ester cyclase [Ralstonia sp. RS642]UZF23894.1 ester cyclase [Ralstonia sp. RS642]
MTASFKIDVSKLTTHPLGIAAVEFADMVAHQKKVDEAAATYLAEPYIQHNPKSASGVDAFRIGMKAIVSAVPNRRYDIQRVFVDGDFVILHSHVTSGPGDRGVVIVDIYRAANGKFVEHWDVMQPVPEESANGNTMY